MTIFGRAPWLRNTIVIFRADALIRRRGWESWFEEFAEVLLYATIGFMLVASLYAQPYGAPPWWTVQALVAMAAPVACAVLLVSFTGFPTNSPAVPLILTLPIETRSRFGYFVISRISRDLRAALWAFAPPALYIPIVWPSVDWTEVLSLVFVVLGCTLASIVGHRLSIATAANWRARWVVVIVFAVSATAPLLAGALTADWTGYSWIAGPGFAFAALALLPIHFGFPGLVAAAIISFVAGSYLLFAKVDLDDEPEDLETVTPQEVPPDLVPPVAKAASSATAPPSSQATPGTGWAMRRRTRIVRQVEEISAALKAEGDDLPTPPLDIPRGLEPALVFFKPEPMQTWGPVVATLAILAAMAGFLVALLFVDLSGLVGPAWWALPVVYIASVALVARQRAPNRTFRQLLAVARKSTLARAKLLGSREKPAASELRGWIVFETLPVERAVLERLFLQPNGLAALAIAAGFLAVVALLPLPPFLWWQGAFSVPGLAALLGFVFAIRYWFLAVPGESTKAVRALGVAGLVVWACASGIVGALAIVAGRLPTLPSLWGPYQWSLLFGAVVLTAVYIGVGYQTLRESLVVSLLPEMSWKRLLVVAAGASVAVGCAATSIALAIN